MYSGFVLSLLGYGTGLPDPVCCQAGANDTLLRGPQAAGESQAQWLQGLKSWRAATLEESSYDSEYYSNGSAYNDPRLHWAFTTYVQPQVHLWDRYLYNETSHSFTVQRYLDDLKARYGGIDSVLLWPTYPNIGIDARNQWDLWRALPGGLPAVKKLTEEFHGAGVRVLWAYNPFDQGLKDEGEAHWTTLARLLKETGGDGFNGDTMYSIYKEFIDASNSLGYPIVGEPEQGGVPMKTGRSQDKAWTPTDHILSWGYYHDGTSDGITNLFWHEPGVDRAKWLAPHGRRQTHVCDRWAKDRHSPMQFAHFNGVGYESWENVWGINMHFTDRDAEALKRNQKVWRWLGTSNFTQSYTDWEPFTPEIKGSGLYASRWRHANGTCAWTVVNRDEQYRTFDLEVDFTVCKQGRIFDIYTGRKVTHHGLGLEGLGYGAYVLTSEDSLPIGLHSLLDEMRLHGARPLSSYDASWAPMLQVMQSTGNPKPQEVAPEGSVLVPRTRYRFQTGGVEIEGGCDPSKDTAGTGNCCTSDVLCPSDDPRCISMCAFNAADDRGVDVQFPWEPSPRRFHDAWLDIGPFYMDKFPVTNAQFAKYINASLYESRDPHNFLKHWANSSYLPKDANKPVVWVSLAEARGFCEWSGKRLPHAYEWQLSAQGTDGRTYPWGHEHDAARYPVPGHGREVPELPDVGNFPQGNSPMGVSDLVGLVWQFTDEFQDDRTRAALLKGSSIYNPVLGGDFPALPQVGNWYFPPARKLTQHNRLLLMDESYDRAATLGFRCVADHPDGAAAPYHLHSASEVDVLI